MPDNDAEIGARKVGVSDAADTSASTCSPAGGRASGSATAGCGRLRAITQWSQVILKAQG